MNRSIFFHPIVFCVLAGLLSLAPEADHLHTRGQLFNIAKIAFNDFFVVAELGKRHPASKVPSTYVKVNG